MRGFNPEEFTDKNINEYLISIVPIELHCVYQPKGRGGLIHSYMVEDGRLWVELIEDDGLNEACVNYLKRQGAPVFEYIDDLENYGKKLLAENPIPEGAWNLHAP